MERDASINVDITSYKEPVTLELCDVGYSIKEKKDGKVKQILQGISGKFEAGRLTAILGPSGAGKSSLLNILSGSRTTGVTGSVLVNGEPISKSDYRKKCSYILQEFSMLGKLTTLETLKMATSLKLNSKIPHVVKMKIINDIVHILNLGKCLETYVQNLSGGEKKRLSIGVELITNPPVMLFDEPTSGLDSSSSLQILTHLRELAKGGRNIICVIHQPSSRLMELFDDIFVLSNGQCIYQGTLEDIIPTFETAGYFCPDHYNRADFVVEVANQEIHGNIEMLLGIDRKVSTVTNLDSDETAPMLVSVLKNPEISNQKPRPEFQNQYATSFWNQFCVLTKRSLMCTSRDLLYAQLRVVCSILVAGLLGIVFYDVGSYADKIVTSTACLMFFIMFIFFANAMPTVLTFPSETGVFVREHLNNWYSLEAYYISKVVANMPLQVICPSLFVALAYFLCGLPAEYERFLMVWLICLLMAVLADSLGMAVGSCCDIQMGMFIVPVTCIPSLIFSGFFIKFNELSKFLQPFCYISYFRYGFEGLMHAVYSFGRQDLECKEPFCYFGSLKKYMQFVDMSENNFWMDVTGLIVFIICLQILLYLILRFKLKKLH